MAPLVVLGGGTVPRKVPSEISFVLKNVDNGRNGRPGSGTTRTEIPGSFKVMRLKETCTLFAGMLSNTPDRTYGGGPHFTDHQIDSKNNTIDAAALKTVLDHLASFRRLPIMGRDFRDRNLPIDGYSFTELCGLYSTILKLGIIPVELRQGHVREAITAHFRGDNDGDHKAIPQDLILFNVLFGKDEKWTAYVVRHAANNAFFDREAKAWRKAFQDDRSLELSDQFVDSVLAVARKHPHIQIQ